MRRGTIAFAIAVIGLTVVSAGTPAAAIPPPPSFDVSCTVGADTGVSWKHAHVTSLDIEWYDSAGNLRATGPNLIPKGPRFSTTTPTTVDVDGWASVTVFFSEAPGGAKLQPETCT